METTFLSTAKHAIPSHIPDLATLARFVLVTHNDLPDAIAFVPALCRLIAIALFIPVIALAVVRPRSASEAVLALDETRPAMSRWGAAGGKRARTDASVGLYRST